jgi:hypothetical protein
MSTRDLARFTASPHIFPMNPAEYLAKLKTLPSDARKQIANIAHMPYPADPLLEPEFVGLTYYQVGLLKQAGGMALGLLDSMEFFTDRLIGKPAQVNLNLNTNAESYTEFLDRIAKAEAETIDVENELGL